MTTLTPKPHAEAIALFRSEIVGALTRRELDRGELSQALTELSQQRFWPPGAKATKAYSVATLERWYYAYKSGIWTLFGRHRGPTAAVAASSPRRSANSWRRSAKSTPRRRCRSSCARSSPRVGSKLAPSRPAACGASTKSRGWSFWRTLREGCLDFLGSLGSLHDLNVRLWAFVDQYYHRAPHGGLLGKSPAAVYEETPRPVDTFDESMLRKALTIHARRRVRRDSTLPMDGTDWETDLHFLAGRLVTVSRCVIDPSEPPWIEHEGRVHLLHPVNAKANAQ